MQALRIGGKKSRTGQFTSSGPSESWKPKVNGVVYQHIQIGYAHSGVIPYLGTPQCVDALRTRRCLAVQRCEIEFIQFFGAGTSGDTSGVVAWTF